MLLQAALTSSWPIIALASRDYFVPAYYLRSCKPRLLRPAAAALYFLSIGTNTPRPVLTVVLLYYYNTSLSFTTSSYPPGLTTSTAILLSVSSEPLRITSEEQSGFAFSVGHSVLLDVSGDE